MIPRIRLACGWALVALIGVVINLVVLIAAPVLRPDLDLFQKSLSYYAVGPWGIVQAIAFGALGISSIALGAALHDSSLASRWLWPTVLLLTVSGVASLGLVWYPIDAPGPTTFLGDAHQTAGTVGGVTQLAAALVFAIAVRADSVWEHYSFPHSRCFFLPSLARYSLRSRSGGPISASPWAPPCDSS